VERGDWKGAADLQIRPSPYAYVDAITHFARAIGAARSGQPDAATADIAKLAELRDKLRDAKDAYWSEQVDVQWQVASAWVLHTEGKYDDALTAMSATADAEDKTEKHVVTPGGLKPARELYGLMLLDRGMAKEALAAFEATLKKEPNRRAPLWAQRMPPKSTATQPKHGVLSQGSRGRQWRRATRTEVADARAFMAKKR
jgi:hypothetical protein